MVSLSLRFFAMATSLSVVSAAATITGAISGTCGFYQGSLSNVVYSESFSGDGTFCAGFISGASFLNEGTVQIGDIEALAHNRFYFTVPAGYGAFVDYTTTLQVTQNYNVNSLNPLLTPDGYLAPSLSETGATDDGSGFGFCGHQASVTINGVAANGAAIPITFGQPIAAVETAEVTCNDYSGVGLSFGEDGYEDISGNTATLLDPNRSYIGPATLTNSAPEPATFLLLPLAAALLIVGLPRRRL